MLKGLLAARAEVERVENDPNRTIRIILARRDERSEDDSWKGFDRRRSRTLEAGGEIMAQDYSAPAAAMLLAGAILPSLAGCGSSEVTAQVANQSAAEPSRPSSAEAPGAPKPIDFGNRYSTELASRGAGEQALLLARVVRSSDETCPVGSDAEYKGHDGRQAFWVVSCGRHDFLVSIDRRSSTSVMSCDLAAKLHLSCRGKW